MTPIDRSFVSLNELQSLPAFAAFLLAEKLEDYSRLQMQYSNEIDIPLLKFFSGMKEEEMLTMTRNSVTEYLTFLSQNKAAEFIENAIARWKSNHLPVVDRDSIVAEDLTLIIYLRKKTLLHFLPSFTQDPFAIVETVKEIDLFLTQYLTIATNTYIDLLKERVEDHSHFIEKVNETLPGSIYVFDRLHYKGVYSNNKLAQVIGYEQSELNELGQDAVSKLVHPEDQETLRKQAIDMQNAKDGETVVCQYRIRDKNGDYKWMSSHEAVFKRR